MFLSAMFCCYIKVSPIPRVCGDGQTYWYPQRMIINCRKLFLLPNSPGGSPTIFVG